MIQDMEVQDLSSNFAGKSHALLCREYIKGRDWYDFIWYVSNEIPINFTFLSKAINQQGPWLGQEIDVNPDWYLTALKEKIYTIDWSQAAREVSPFLNELDRKTLKFWGIPLFVDRIKVLEKILNA